MRSLVTVHDLFHDFPPLDSDRRKPVLFLTRGNCYPTVVRWRKSLISYVDKQQASDSRLMLGSLDVETLGPLEKFVGMGRDFVDANRDLFLRVGRTSLLAR